MGEWEIRGDRRVPSRYRSVGGRSGNYPTIMDGIARYVGARQAGWSPEPQH